MSYICSGPEASKWSENSKMESMCLKGLASHDHLSLVAPVKNLRTSYVSLQFHVRFDDLFQTIFSSSENDMVDDAICNHLLESNHDV